MNWTAWIAGGAMTLITGVATWWIAHWHSRLDEKRRMKRQLLTDLMANRYDLTGHPFSRALNASAVVFADSPAVREAIWELHSNVVNGAPNEEVQTTLLRMIRQMFDDLKLPYDDHSDRFLLHPFNTRATSRSQSISTSK